MSEEALWKEVRELRRELESIRQGRGFDAPKRLIYAEYNTNAGQSIPNGSVTIVNFEDKVIDTHNAVTIGANWKFTSPASTHYLLNTLLLFSSSYNWELAETAEVKIFKNDIDYKVIDRKDSMYSVVTAQYRELSGNTSIYLKTNDYINVRIYQNSEGALNFYNDNDLNWITILGIQ